MTGVQRLGACTLATALIITTVYSASFPPPQWAYGAGDRGARYADDGKPKHLTGSTRAYTFTQVEDSFAPADWYPQDHPPMPLLPVATGRKPDVRACSWCHLPNGFGHPQSASLAGLSTDYLAQQLANFKSGARHSSVGNSIMLTITRAMAPEEARAAVTYYSKLQRRPWIKVVETTMTPKTEIVEGGLRIPQVPEILEPLGDRVVEVPQFPARTQIYDSHAGFVAYVPLGSIKRGQDLVATGQGKVQPCSRCHGKDYRGVEHPLDSAPPTPALAGRSATYIVRQLYDFNSGARSDKEAAAWMRPVAMQMSLRDMIDAAAYLSSLAP